MEKFREKIKRRINISLGVSGLALVLLSAMNFLHGTILGDGSHINEFIAGFQVGLFLGLEVVLLFKATKLKKALKDNELLKALYIKETDERELLIDLKANSLTITIMIIGTTLATIAAGFLNPIVFITLLVVLAFEVILKQATRLYYNRVL